MPIDRTWYNTLVDDTGDNLSGTPWNKAAVNSLLNAIDAMGAWADVAFNAANFGSNTGTWAPTAGQVSLNRWAQIGNVLYWDLTISPSTITGAPTILYANTPRTIVASGALGPVGYVLDAGVLRTCYVQPVTTAALGISRADGGAFTAGSALTVYLHHHWQVP